MTCDTTPRGHVTARRAEVKRELNKTNWKAEGSMEASDFEGTLPTNKELYQVRIFETCSLCGPNPGPSPNPKSLRSFSRAVFSTETI